MANLEEQTEQGFYGSPLYKRLGLPEFRSKEEIKEGLTSLAVGPVTGTLGLPSDILDLANLANDLSADYTGNVLAKAIQPKLNEIQEKYGRDAFDKGFTELTGIKSDASDVNQMVGELVSLGGLAKAGVSGAKVLTKTAKDVADQTKNLLKPKIDKAKDVIQTTVDQTKQAFQPQLATADGISIPDGIDINRDVIDTSKLENVLGQDSDVGQEAYSKFLQKGFDKVDPTPENMLQAIKETGGYISKDGKFRAIVDPTKATFNTKNVDLLEGGSVGDSFYEEVALDITNEAGIKLDINKLTKRMEDRTRGAFGSLTVSDLLDYEGLYSQFDQLPPSGKPFINKYTQKPFKPLRDIKIQFINPKLEAIQGGHYDVGDDVIRISRRSLDLGYTRKLLIHELQHAVQHRMGLTSGDNTRSFLKDINHRKIYEGDLKQANNLGDARGSNISKKIDVGELPDFLAGIDLMNYYGRGGNIYVNDKVIKLSEKLNKSYFDIFKEEPFEVINYSKNINNKIFNALENPLNSTDGTELTNMHIDFLFEALARKINIREGGKLKKLFGDKEGSVLDGNKYVTPADNKPLVEVMNHSQKNISSTDLNNYDRQRPELFDQGHKTVDNPLKDIFDITNDNGEFEKHIKDIIFEKNNTIHRYVYGKNSLKVDSVDFENLDDGKGYVLIDSSNSTVIGDVVPNLEKQQELVDFYKKLLEDIKAGNIGKNTVTTDPIFGDTVRTPFEKFKIALKDQTDARVALNRTNTKNAASGLNFRNDYGLEVVGYTDDEVLKYKKAKKDAFKAYMSKLGETESRVAEYIKNIDEYPEATKKYILENEEILLQEDVDKLHGKITGDKPEPSLSLPDARKTLPALKAVDIKNLDATTKKLLGKISMVDKPMSATYKNIFSNETNDAIETVSEILYSDTFGGTKPYGFYKNISESRLNKIKKNIYDLTQKKLASYPDEIIVYRSGTLDPKNIKKKGLDPLEEPLSFTLDPKYNPELNLPWYERMGAQPLQAYKVKKKDILASTDLRREMGEDEIIIRPKDVKLVEENVEMNKGGVPTMQKKNIESQQLELFGGMKDQGGAKDPVSGNDVPVGSTKKEVRDDIPAQLSEGEFVLPSDVVRYHGLEKIMGLRDQAKQGLGKMEAMGQMGNSDEATLPDDTPFMANTGGVAGVNIQDPAQLQKQQSIFQTTRPQGQQVQTPTAQTPTVQTPTVQTPTTSTTAPRTFKDTMGGTEFGQLPVAEQRQYKNTATGETKSFTFVNGKPVYPIPAGFVPIEKAGVEAPDVVKDVLVPTTQVTKEDKDRPSVSQVAGTGSFSLGNLNLGSLAGGAIGSIFGPFGSFMGSQIGGQLGQQEQMKPIYDINDPRYYDQFTEFDYKTGGFGYAGGVKTGSVGTNVGDTDVNTKGTFNNSFAVADNISDLHKYGGAMRDENGHTVYRTITEQVNSLKAAAKTGWFGGPLSPMEYYGLTDDNKMKYNSYAGEFGITEQNYGSGKGAELYQEFLNEMSKYNIGGAGNAPSSVADENGQGGDGYLVSNGKAHKGKYIRNKTTGDMQFEREDGKTIVAVTGPDGTAKVGDLTGSGMKTQPLVKKEDEMAGVAEAQAAEQRRKDEAEARRKEEAEANRQKARDEFRQDLKEQRNQGNISAQMRGGKAGGDMFNKGGLMTKPKKKTMKRGGLASR